MNISAGVNIGAGMNIGAGINIGAGMNIGAGVNIGAGMNSRCQLALGHCKRVGYYTASAPRPCVSTCMWL